MACSRTLTNTPPIATSTSLVSGTNTLITGGHWQSNHINNTVSPDLKPGFKRLSKETAPRAFFNARQNFDLPRCHPGTRIAVLERIQGWIQGDVNPECPVMWLYGAAGAGKSSIARSVAEWCDEKKLLLASFFFSRSDLSRNHIKPVIATLAYATVQSIPECRALIEQAIESNPHIFHLSLKEQFHRLILEPHFQVTQADSLRRLPYVIVIDGLDECVRNADAIVKLLSSTLDKKSPFKLKVLVASRPESVIRNSFNDSMMTKLTIPLALSDEYHSDDDIRRFLQDKFTEIKRNSPSKAHLPHSWPSKMDIERLVWKSSGQFIYAATVIKYISSGKRIKARLRTVLDVGSTKSPNDGKDGLPFAHLDALYTHILTSTGEGQLEMVTQTMAVCFLFLSCPSRDSWPYIDRSPENIIADILDFDIEDVAWTLEELSSVIHVGLNYVSLYHTSMSDFLFDPSRSGRLWVDQALIWSKLVRSYLRFLSSTSDYQLSITLIRAVITGLKRARSTEQLTQSFNSFDSALVLTRIRPENPFDDDLHLSWVRLLAFLNSADNWVVLYRKLVSTYDHWLACTLQRQSALSRTHRARVAYCSIRPYPNIASVLPTCKPHDPPTYLELKSLFSDKILFAMLEEGQLPEARACVLDGQASAVCHCIHFLIENAVTGRLVYLLPGPDRSKSRPWLWRRRPFASTMPHIIRIGLSRKAMRRRTSRAAVLPFGTTLSISECVPSDTPRCCQWKQVHDTTKSALRSIPRLLKHSAVSPQLVFSLRAALTLTCTSRDLRSLWRKAKKAMTSYLVNVAGLKSPRRVRRRLNNHCPLSNIHVNNPSKTTIESVTSTANTQLTTNADEQVPGTKLSLAYKLHTRIPLFNLNGFLKQCCIDCDRGWEQRKTDVSDLLEVD